MSAFETTTCGRCGGHGTYSRNAYGSSRCYDCGGSGQKMSKRGAAAQRMFRDLIRVEPSKVQPGWFVWWDDVALNGAKRWVRVADVKTADDGAVIFRTEGGNTAGIKGGKIRAVESINQRNEAILKALAFQATLNPKTGKPATQKAAA